jgi:hypothetical protein
MPNREVLVKLDNCYRRGANFGLSEFIAKRPPLALSVDEEREIKVTEHPITREPFKRAVIHDTNTNTRRYEVGFKIVAGVRVRETLHMSTDFGNIGYPHTLFLLGACSLRGSFIFDRWHVITCLWDEATTYGRLALVKALCGVELNMMRGAFDKELNFAKLHASGKDLFHNCNHTISLFRYLADDIAFEFEFRDPDLSGDNWYQDLWLECKRRWESSGIGEEARRSRWWSFERRGRSNRPLRGLTFMVVIVYGFRKRWWLSLDTSPLLAYGAYAESRAADGDAASPSSDEAEDDDDMPALIAGGAPDAEDDRGDVPDKPLTRAQAKAEMKKRRDHTSATIKFVAQSLSKSQRTVILPFVRVAKACDG